VYFEWTKKIKRNKITDEKRQTTQKHENTRKRDFSLHKHANMQNGKQNNHCNLRTQMEYLKKII